jgi:hypothetical protein
METSGPAMPSEIYQFMHAYIEGFLKRDDSEGVFDCLFEYESDKAKSWPTKAEADARCAFLETLEIGIVLLDGGKHICKGFKSEQRANGEFVISCEIPPTSQQARPLV